jgi:hypothetical protein
MSMKNSKQTIGNRTRDLPTCSAVTQPTTPPSASRVWARKVIRGIKSSGLLHSVTTLVILDGISKRLVSATMLLIANNQKTSVFKFSAVETSYYISQIHSCVWNEQWQRIILHYVHYFQCFQNSLFLFYFIFFETVTQYWHVFTYYDKHETVKKTNSTQKTAGN